MALITPLFPGQQGSSVKLSAQGHMAWLLPCARPRFSISSCVEGTFPLLANSLLLRPSEGPSNCPFYTLGMRRPGRHLIASGRTPSTQRPSVQPGTEKSLGKGRTGSRAQALTNLPLATVASLPFLYFCFQRYLASSSAFGLTPKKQSIKCVFFSVFLCNWYEVPL